MKTGIVMLAVPFSLVGALWTLYLLGYHMSTAVWVGMIALMGVDAQTGVFMLLYLDLAYERCAAQRPYSQPRRSSARGSGGRGDADPAKVHDGRHDDHRAVADLLVRWPGSDLMKRIAAPMAGGMTSSFLMELLIYPVLYMIWRRRELLSAATAPVRPEFITAVMSPIFLPGGRRPFNGNDQLLK